MTSVRNTRPRTILCLIFLASSASVTQIDYFFKSDSALNLLFFDLVAMGLVGSLPETRAEIAQNLWDEIGQGSQEITR